MPARSRVLGLARDAYAVQCETGRVRRRLASVVLVFEAMVVFFAILVAKDLSDLSTGALTLLGGGLALVCLLLCGLLRYDWAYLAGSVLQVLLVLTGIVVPVMWFVGGIFAAMWFGFLYLSVVADRMVAQRTAAEDARAAHVDAAATGQERSAGAG